MDQKKADPTALLEHNRAKLEPMEAPVNTIVASVPTDPPKPMVRVLAIIEV